MLLFGVYEYLNVSNVHWVDFPLSGLTSTLTSISVDSSSNVYGVALDPTGGIYFAQYYTVHRLSSLGEQFWFCSFIASYAFFKSHAPCTGIPSLLAGGANAFANGVGASAGFNGILSMIFDNSTNTLVVVDNTYNRIRRISTSGKTVV